MPRVLVYSPHLLTGLALVRLLESLGFEGVLSSALEDTEEGEGSGSLEVALWDLCSYSTHYPPPPAMPTLAMVSDQEESLAELLRLGYRGFLKVHEGPDTLKRALLALRRGEVWAERWVMAEALTPRENRRLTSQEHKVLSLLTQGLSNKDIASALGVGEKTVKGYLSKLFDKMGAKNRTDLILQHMKNRP